jgi:hypothetical protein
MPIIFIFSLISRAMDFLPIRLGKAFFIQTYINNNSVLMDLNQTTLSISSAKDL